MILLGSGRCRLGGFKWLSTGCAWAMSERPTDCQGGKSFYSLPIHWCRLVQFDWGVELSAGLILFELHAGTSGRVHIVVPVSTNRSNIIWL